MINRLGFNSEGAHAVLRRLAVRVGAGGIVGVNVGANKDSKDRIADYVRQIEMFAPVASYFTCNISSPNTPGLRDLQQGRVFDELLARVMEARARITRKAGTTPVLIKIAPDLTLSELDDVVGAARRHRVDGMVIGNTTVLRPAWLRDRETAHEPGGLSGRPLFALATRMLAETYVRVENAFPLIGVGGIDSGETALAKIRAGGMPGAALQCARIPRVWSGGPDQSLIGRCDALRPICRHCRPCRRRCRRNDGGAVAGITVTTSHADEEGERVDVRLSPVRSANGKSPLFRVDAQPSPRFAAATPVGGVEGPARIRCAPDHSAASRPTARSCRACSRCETKGRRRRAFWRRSQRCSAG